jgi:hypothetical protein
MAKEPPDKSATKADRSAREAEALRANLRKRKEQARQREAAREPTPDKKPRETEKS